MSQSKIGCSVKIFVARPGAKTEGKLLKSRGSCDIIKNRIRPSLLRQTVFVEKGQGSLNQSIRKQRKEYGK